MYSFTWKDIEDKTLANKFKLKTKVRYNINFQNNKKPGLSVDMGN